MTEIDSSTALTPNPNRSLDELLSRFLQAQDVAAGSRVTYEQGVRRFLAHLNTERVTEPTREHILAYKRCLEAAGLSALTVSNYLVAVRKFFEWAESIKLYPNVARGVKGTKRARGFRKDCLTVQQVRDLLASIDRGSLIGKRDFAFLNLLVRTGLRTIEVIRADLGDIRQEAGEPVLWVQGKGYSVKDDFVLLTAASMEPIRDYLTARGTLGDSEPLFASESWRNRSERLTTRTLRRIVKERLSAIGLNSKRLSAHSLRHTAVTLSLQGGATIQEAQSMARHTSIDTTMVYAHSLNRIAQAPERRIDELLKGVS